MEAGRLPYLVGYAPLRARQWLRNGGRSGTGAAAAEANTTGLESRLSESSGPKFSHERVVLVYFEVLLAELSPPNGHRSVAMVCVWAVY